MKFIRGSTLGFTLLAVAVICVACSKEETAPVTPPVTNTPAVIAPPTAPVVAAVAPTNAVPPAVVVQTLSPSEARNHLGDVATVRGKVFGVHISQKGDAFISMGAAYPNAPFTAVCFQGAIPAEDLKKLEGKTVSVKGLIKEYNGQIEIVLERREQISE